MNQTAGVFASLRHAAAPPMAYEKELLDHLVGAGEQRRRHRDPERLGGLEIDHQLELRRLFDRQLARFGAFQNFIHVGRSAPHRLANP